MSILTSIRGPEDLKRFDPSQLSQLASEIRDFLIAARPAVTSGRTSAWSS